MKIDAQYVALVGVAVTLVLGIYNAVQNYRTSKRTTFINTVTSERIKWIEKLRQSISTFCGLAHYWRFSTVKGTPDERQKIEEIDKLRHLIVLQLSPGGCLNEACIDKEIQQLVDEVVSMSSRHLAVSDDEYRECLRRLTKSAQTLLKEEWDKVKKESVEGDLSRAAVAQARKQKTIFTIIAVVAVVLGIGVVAATKYATSRRQRKVMVSYSEVYRDQTIGAAQDHQSFETTRPFYAEEKLVYMLTGEQPCFVLTHSAGNADYLVKISVTRNLGDPNIYGEASLLVEHDGDVVSAEHFYQDRRSSDDISDQPIKKAWTILCSSAAR